MKHELLKTYAIQEPGKGPILIKARDYKHASEICLSEYGFLPEEIPEDTPLKTYAIREPGRGLILIEARDSSHASKICLVEYGFFPQEVPQEFEV